MYFPIITLYRLIKKGQLLVCVIYEIHANETVLPKGEKIQGTSATGRKSCTEKINTQSKMYAEQSKQNDLHRNAE